MRAWLLVCVLAGCGSAIHDPLLDVDAGVDAGDSSDASVGDASVRSGPLLAGVYMLAPGAINGSIHAFQVPSAGTGTPPLQIVAIDELTGKPTTVVTEDATKGIDLQVTSSGIFWTETTDNLHVVLRSAALDGSANTILFDPATLMSGEVPAGSVLRAFYRSDLDQNVYVATAVGATAQLGSVPAGGGAYTKVSDLGTGMNGTITIPNRFGMAVDAGVLYVLASDGGGSYVTAVTGLSTMAQIKAPVGAMLNTVTSHAGHGYCTDTTGSLYGITTMASLSAIETVPLTPSALAVLDNALVIATGGSSVKVLAAKDPNDPKPTFATVANLTCAGASCTPTLAVDGTTAYVSTGSEIDVALF